MTPTARTLNYLAKHGAMAGVVERFNAHAGPFGQRFDLFGLFDVVAVRPRVMDFRGQYEIVGIQCCSIGTRAEHEQKMLSAEKFKKDEASNYEKLRLWLRAGGCAELWAWRKRVRLKKDLTPSKTPQWTCSVTDFVLTLNRNHVATGKGEL